MPPKRDKSKRDDPDYRPSERISPSIQHFVATTRRRWFAETNQGGQENSPEQAGESGTAQVRASASRQDTLPELHRATELEIERLMLDIIVEEGSQSSDDSYNAAEDENEGSDSDREGQAGAESTEIVSVGQEETENADTSDPDDQGGANTSQENPLGGLGLPGPIAMGDPEQMLRAIKDSFAEVATASKRIT